MTQPALTMTQGQEYDDNIKKVTGLITTAKLNLLDIRANNEEDTRIAEFDAFNAFLTWIDYKVASVNGWKALKIQNVLDIRSRNNTIQKPNEDSTKNEPNTPRFHSLALLCLGANRCYPNTNDVFHSPT